MLPGFGLQSRWPQFQLARGARAGDWIRNWHVFFSSQINMLLSLWITSTREPFSINSQIIGKGRSSQFPDRAAYILLSNSVLFHSGYISFFLVFLER